VCYNQSVPGNDTKQAQCVGLYLEGRQMSTSELDGVIERLLPQVLADRDLGDGRRFTRLHLDRLWALSCLQVGECYDPELLAQHIRHRLPAKVQDVCTPHA
jgi:hypothetical protein